MGLIQSFINLNDGNCGEASSSAAHQLTELHHLFADQNCEDTAEGVDMDIEEGVIPILQLPRIAIQQPPFSREFLSISIGSPNKNQQIEAGNKHIEHTRSNNFMEIIDRWELVQRILDYLSHKDDQQLMLCSRKLNEHIMVHRLIKRGHLWDTLLYQLQQSKIYNSDHYAKICNQDEESEHSLDLDRNQSYFLEEEDKHDKQAKLDRVLRALGIHIPYFQGLNSVVAVLLAYFEEKDVYWIARRLVDQCGNLPNNCEKYMEFLEDATAEVSASNSRVYAIIDKYDLNVEYFAMKWVLSLFSCDLERNLLLSLWGMLGVFGTEVLKWTTVGVFLVLGGIIEEIEHSDDLLCGLSKADRINKLLKEDMKVRIVDGRREDLLSFVRKQTLQAKVTRTQFRSVVAEPQGLRNWQRESDKQFSPDILVEQEVKTEECWILSLVFPSSPNSNCQSEKQAISGNGDCLLANSDPNPSQIPAFSSNKNELFISSSNLAIMQNQTETCIQQLTQ